MENLKKCIAEYKNSGLITRAAVRVGIGDDIVGEHYLDTDPNTLFDMASVTKIVATTMLTLITLERGSLSLGESMRWFYRGSDSPLTIKHLMTHTIGIGHKPLNLQDVSYQNVDEYILSLEPDIKPGTDVLYSCPAFILLGKIVEKRLGLPLDAAFEKYVAQPLGMSATRFCPSGGDIVNANRTEAERGIVNDYNCRHLGGVCGNAGLFSNIADMTKFVKMMRCHGAPLVCRQTFDNAAKCHTVGMSESRGLGFLVTDERYTQTGALFENGSIGHCGHTGQSVFVDLQSGLYAIVLTDATLHAAHYDEVKQMRKDIHNAISNDIKKPTHIG